MKLPACHLILLAALAGIPTGPCGAEEVAPAAGAVDGNAITALASEPATVRLAAGARAAFLITERRADGFEVDATETVVLSLSGPDKAVLEAPGVLRARQAGSLLVIATKGTHRLEIPVEITAPSTEPVSFVRDVLPILGKSGCNAGACHAKAAWQ